MIDEDGFLNRSLSGFPFGGFSDDVCKHWGCLVPFMQQAEKWLAAKNFMGSD